MALKTRENPLTLEIIRGMTFKKHVSQKGRLYASSSGYCPRQTTLQALYEGDEIQEPSTTAYFELGVSWEKIILDSLFRQGDLLFADFITPDIGINVGGKMDGIIRLPNEPIKILEVKTCGSTLPTKPKPDQAAQAQLYSAIGGFQSVLTYAGRPVEDKNSDLLLRSFDLPYDKDTMYNAMYTAVYGAICSQEGVMPLGTIDKESQCGFCRFKGICWHGEKSFLPEISTLDHRQRNSIYVDARDTTDFLMSAEQVTKRRNGILKHISESGTVHAQELLKNKDWSDLYLTL